MWIRVSSAAIFTMPISPRWWAAEQGRRPAGSDYSERHRKPLQPHRDCGGHHLSDGEARLPTHISVAPLSCGLPKESVILLEQVRTLDKRRLREKMGRLDDGVMKQVDTAIAVSFGLHPETMV